MQISGVVSSNEPVGKKSPDWTTPVIDQETAGYACDFLKAVYHNIYALFIHKNRSTQV